MMSTEEYMSTIPHTDMVSTRRKCGSVDGVALGAVCGWTGELHDLVRCIERGNLHEGA